MMVVELKIFNPIIYYCHIVRVYSLIFFILSLLLCNRTAYGFDPTWWSSVAQLAVHQNPEAFSLSVKPLCGQLPGLSPGQARICELFMDHMPSVGAGAKQAIEECQFQFKNRRWNCSTPYGSGVFGPIHLLGTREAAFTYGIVAAGVTWEISRGCRLGQLSTCHCNQENRPNNLNKDFLWGGCGDNIQYGYQFSQNFIDIREREKDIPQQSSEYGRALMNRWNNEVGRRAVKRLSRVACKCHGVSGSCNLKTCWKQLPNMRDVGDLMLTRYDEAVRVKLSRRGNLKLLKGGRKRRAAQMDLVYLEESPDYCRTDVPNGMVGTEGRGCNRTGNALDSCEMLCCGRGYNTMKHIISEKCQCKFVWCCRVQCKTCQTKVEVHACK